MSESKVLLFCFLLQFSIPCYKSNVGNKVQFLVVNCSSIFVVVIVVRFVSVVRANTIKQGILYRTCTGPSVEVIGLAPYTWLAGMSLVQLTEP